MSKESPTRKPAAAGAQNRDRDKRFLGTIQSALGNSPNRNRKTREARTTVAPESEITLSDALEQIAISNEDASISLAGIILMANNGAVDSSPPIDPTPANSSVSYQDGDIIFTGPMTLRALGHDFIAFLAGHAEIDPSNIRIIYLNIGGRPLDWQRLTDQQLDMQFVHFINQHVINDAKPFLRRRMPRTLLDGPGRIFFTFFVDDGQSNGNDKNHFCIYKMDGSEIVKFNESHWFFSLHFNKKIPNDKRKRKKPQNFLLTFPLEPIDERVE